MQVQEIMTKKPYCCTPEIGLPQVARMMLDHDCGAIPVTSNGRSSRQLIGMITDRDIVCRAVAEDADLSSLTVADCMSSPVVVVTPEMSLEECCNIMEKAQIRRVPVVDTSGDCCGIVAQADIARHAPNEETAEVVKEISEPLKDSKM